jgi:dolichol-phosphate mannosyltransferase
MSHIAPIDLSIVIPSYLEEENLQILIPRIIQQASNITKSFEILIIDTITPMDGTQELCNATGVSYIPRQGGNRYGDAVRTGIQAAKGQYLIFMDADGSHPPHFIKRLYRAKDNSDVVIASRYTDGGITENHFVLILMSRIVNLGYRLILGLKPKDISNSFKLYKTKQIKELTLNCNNFDIVEEILFKLVRRNKDLKIIEIPFSFKKRMFGKTKRNLVLFIFTYALTLIKLRFFK